MKRTLSLAAGFAAGYVVGAHAGREQYEQIQQRVRQLGEIPAVAETRAALRGRIDSASHAVAGKIAETPSDGVEESAPVTGATGIAGISSVPAQTKRNVRGSGAGTDSATDSESSDNAPTGRRTVFPATGIHDGGADGVVP